MFTCDNCGARFGSADLGISVVYAGKAISSVCPQCLEGVKLAKIVIERDPTTRTFTYNQYAPLEMVAKVFGRTS